MMAHACPVVQTFLARGGKGKPVGNEGSMYEVGRTAPLYKKKKETEKTGREDGGLLGKSEEEMVGE